LELRRTIPVLALDEAENLGNGSDPAAADAAVTPISFEKVRREIAWFMIISPLLAGSICDPAT
jgi:hypothetical protein